MNAMDLMEAIGYADEELVQEAIDCMNKKIEKTTTFRRGKVLGTALAAVLIVCLLTTTAYAAGHYFGLFDFWGDRGRQSSPDAQSLLVTDIPQEDTGAGDSLPLSFTVKEALCDSERIYLVVEAAAEEPGKWLLMPADALEEDPVCDWGLSGDMSAADYAQSKGLDMLLVNAGIANIDELGISSQSLSFKAAGDDVMDIMIDCGKRDDSSSFQVLLNCVAHVPNASFEDVMRGELRFDLRDTSTGMTASYLPTEPAIPDTQARIVSVQALNTELETYFEVVFTCEDDLWQELNFRLAGSKGFLHGDGVEDAGAGEYVCRFSVERQELDSTLELEAYNPWEDVVYGAITLAKQPGQGGPSAGA